MENVFYSLLCDALRTSTTKALSERIVAQIERRALQRHIVS